MQNTPILLTPTFFLIQKEWTAVPAGVIKIQVRYAAPLHAFPLVINGFLRG